MAKRFIDTSIFRKDFIRSLDAPCKLLWLYIINECDHAGIWDKELDVAEARLGVKFTGDPLKKFDGKIVPIDGGKKWFIPSFIEFQYGVLNKENRAHQSVIQILNKYGIDQNKPLTSPLQGAMVMDKEMDMELDKEMVKEKKAPKFESEVRVIEYYNQATGRKASTTAMSNIKPIAARLKEGLTEQDLFDIVDFKQVEWTGTEMEKHLVIETLFGNKAEKYRTQVQNAKDRGLTAAQIKGNGHQNSKLSKDELGQAVAALYRK